jgi:hypothetical protein
MENRFRTPAGHVIRRRHSMSAPKWVPILTKMAGEVAMVPPTQAIAATLGLRQKGALVAHPFARDNASTRRAR